MARAQAISEAKLAAKVGRHLDVIVDDIDADGIATCRTKADAPEIDGSLFIDEGTEGSRWAISSPSRWTRPGNMISGAGSRRARADGAARDPARITAKRRDSIGQHAARAV